jgi:hypothetical protein
VKKSDLLDRLDQAQQQWEAFLAQIEPNRMDQPGVQGDWSIKDIVAHLTGWNRRFVDRLQAAQRGQPEPAPPWPAQLQDDDAINAWIYAANRERSVDDVLDESRRVYQQLRASIAGLPDDVRIERVDPAYYLVWLGETRFLPAEFFDHFHDDHEPDIRAWLERTVSSQAGF